MLLVLSDLSSKDQIPKHLNPEVIFLLGDFKPRRIVHLIDFHFKCPKFGVTGNHDKDDLYLDTNIINISRELHSWNGKSIGGISGVPRYNSKPYGQFDESEVASYLGNLPPNLDYFLAHTNPLIDEQTDNAHRGSESLSEYIHMKKPKHLFHGHLHEPKEYVIGDTLVHSVYLANQY
ncbi:hypothetical protein AB3N04_01165 (plasmid) [Alkalihalophilus sp. As8PL]|uniref:Calcineurin-like phosphoesterase domain-containing protein n=1 Tax=Alkalihalophilus sp. As8PL TaxID=3237103 RepID=A0AB39BNV4_9BACI